MTMDEPQDKRGLAQNWIEELIHEGMSNTEITDWLREQGLSYRNQEMYRDINRYRLEGFGEEYIHNLGVDDPVPEKYMRTWYGNTRYDYRVVIKYEYLDKQTGMVDVEGTTLYFDHPPSQSEVEALFSVRKDTISLVCHPEREVINSTQVQYFKNTARENR